MKTLLTLLLLSFTLASSYCYEPDSGDIGCLYKEYSSPPKFSNTGEYIKEGDNVCYKSNNWWPFTRSITIKDIPIIKRQKYEVCRKVLSIISSRKNCESVKEFELNHLKETRKLTLDSVYAAHGHFAGKEYYRLRDVFDNKLKYLNSRCREYNTGNEVTMHLDIRKTYNIIQDEYDINIDKNNSTILYNEKQNHIEIFRQDNTLKYSGNIFINDTTISTSGFCYNKTGTSTTKYINNPSLCK